MSFQAIVFNELPVHDTCWSITTGIDGIIYMAVCGEMTGGLGAYIAAYSPEDDTLSYQLSVADAVGCPVDDGHATHGKIHYCLLPAEDGTLYAATHCTTPPAGDTIWRPWHTWDDPVKSFSGSRIFSYKPADDSLQFMGDLVPKQSTRCMALNQDRGLIYGITYPQDHFFVYHIDERRTEDLGRIGSVNPQCIFLDNQGNGYTTNDYGFIIRYSVDKGILEELPVQIPHAPHRDGFHTLPYDAVASPDGTAIYGVTWDFDIRLFRYFPEDGKDGRIEDLGAPYGTPADTWWDIKDEHTGGLVFGLDGFLYYAANLIEDDQKSHLIKLNPSTLEREDMGAIHDGDIYPDHISRATRDYAGNLYFADVGMRPTRVFKYTPVLSNGAAKQERKIIRSWG